MTQPELDLKAAVAWLVAGVMGLINLVLWFSRRDLGRYDKGLERIEVLERNSVTYDHLDKVIDRMRSEWMLMHTENQSTLTRIEEKIDANEERSSKTRHDTKDEVHALALKIAEMSRKYRDNYRG